jgi:hypothetical protein
MTYCLHSDLHLHQDQLEAGAQRHLQLPEVPKSTSCMAVGVDVSIVPVGDTRRKIVDDSHKHPSNPPRRQGRMLSL